MDDRIKYIKELQEKEFKVEPSQTVVMGNFYAIITIVVVCISILYFVNYILPALEVKQQKELRQQLRAQEHQKFLDERARRIALSHKLNKRDYNATK
jgi:hypothetical protein